MDLEKLAAQEAWYDDEEFDPYDFSGGNMDDAYNGGVRDGRIELARELTEEGLSKGLKQIQEDIKIWADAKIPDRTPHGQMKHLEKELNELKDEWEVQDLEKAKVELADIIIVALNLAGQMGFDMEKEVLAKMEINKNRVWSKPDAQGVIHHI